MAPPPRDRPVTIYHVAQAAGVSIASVSRVLQGSTPTSPHTRDKVLAAVRELGYVPLRGRSPLLRLEMHGLVLPTIAGPYYSDLLAGYEEFAGGVGASVTLLSGDSDAPLEDRVLDLSAKVDGMVFLDRAVPTSLMLDVASRIPVVCVGTPAQDQVDSITAESQHATAELVHHLVGHGRTKLRFVGKLTVTRDVRLRYAGFTRAMAEAGLVAVGEPYDVPALEDFGAVIAHDVAEYRGQVDALVCANDELALAVMKALGARGIRVPEDVAVTGFDDIMSARYSIPGLTTVHQPVVELGAGAADLLHDRLAHDPGPARHRELPSQPVHRGSCGCPE